MDQVTNSVRDRSGDKRDPFAEIDEIIKTTKTILAAMANMGEEMIRYREKWTETQEKLIPAMGILGDNFDRQAALNEVLNRSIASCLGAITALEGRVASLEGECFVPMADAIANFEERISALENPRLIIP
jgi:hypothetical protein